MRAVAAAAHLGRGWGRVAHGTERGHRSVCTARAVSWWGARARCAAREVGQRWCCFVERAPTVARVLGVDAGGAWVDVGTVVSVAVESACISTEKKAPSRHACHRVSLGNARAGARCYRHIRRRAKRKHVEGADRGDLWRWDEVLEAADVLSDAVHGWRWGWGHWWYLRRLEDGCCAGGAEGQRRCLEHACMRACCHVHAPTN
jgi:hypothetical protein